MSSSPEADDLINGENNDCYQPYFRYDIKPLRIHPVFLE